MNKDLKLSIEMTVAEAEAVLDALGNLPFKQSAGLIQSIGDQARAQFQKAQQDAQDKMAAGATAANEPQPAADAAA